MREEAVDAGTLAAARARTWDRVSGATAAGCAEFRADFRAYASGALTGNRRVLLEDHLSRCVACRASIAEMKGERRVIAMPQRSSSRWMKWGSLAAAAAVSCPSSMSAATPSTAGLRRVARGQRS